jgi:hypothetical protein
MKTPAFVRSITMLCLLGSASTLSAQVTVYEGFDYDVGSTLPPEQQSGFGWSGGWYNNADTLNTAGSRGLVGAGSLDTPPGMIPTGNHLAMSVFTASSERRFAISNDNESAGINTNAASVTYFSVIGQVSGNSWSFGLYSDRGRNDNPVVAFNLTSGSATMRLYDAYPYESADGAVTRTIASGVSGTFLWVGRLETSSGNDRLDSWIYTDLNNVPVLMPDLQPAPAPYIVVNGSNVNIYNVDAVIDRVGFYLSSGSAIDEIRIGNDWQAVTAGAAAVPEPATVGLLLGAAALTGVIIRRRFRQV